MKVCKVSYSNDEELIFLIKNKIELDNEYPSIPEDYVHQERDFLQNQKQLYSRSDTQTVV